MYLRTNEDYQKISELVDSINTFPYLLFFTGKRNVGKTSILNELIEQHSGIYFHFSMKTETAQLNEFENYINNFVVVNEDKVTFNTWDYFFKTIFDFSLGKKFLLVFDDFLNAKSVENDVFPSLINALNNLTTEHQLILAFSESNLNSTIQEFLFTNETINSNINYSIVNVRPMLFTAVADLFTHHAKHIKIQDMINIYLIFGGYTKYYNLINKFDLWNESIIKIVQSLLLENSSPLLNEYFVLINEQFGRESGIYISILEAIASGKNSITEIADSTGFKVTTISKYVIELEKNKNLIKRRLPLYPYNKDNSKHGRYFISNYLQNFFFRFISPNLSLLHNLSINDYSYYLESKLPEYFYQQYPNLIRELFKNYSSLETIQRIFPHSPTAVGASWNRKFGVDVTVTDDDKHNVMLGSFYDSSFDNENNSIEQIINNHIQIRKLFNDYNVTDVLIHIEELDLKSYSLLNENEFKFIYLPELIGEVYSTENNHQIEQTIKKVTFA